MNGIFVWTRIWRKWMFFNLFMLWLYFSAFVRKVKKIRDTVQTSRRWICERRWRLSIETPISSSRSTMICRRKPSGSSTSASSKNAMTIDRDKQVSSTNNEIYSSICFSFFRFNFTLSCFIFVFHSFPAKDPRYHTSSVGQELRETLSTLQKTTHTFIRQHDELANRAEYLKYTDFVRQREEQQWINNWNNFPHRQIQQNRLISCLSESIQSANFVVNFAN